jgi:hypothetical protein
MKKRYKKPQLVTVGEAYFDRVIRDARVTHLEMEGKTGITKSWHTEYNPKTRRMALVFIVEYLEEPHLVDQELQEKRDELVN